MLPHFSIHGGREQNRRARGQCDGCERMIGQAMREFRDDVRCGRRDEKQVRAIRQLDVVRPPVFFFVKEAGRHWLLGKRLHREGRNEFRRVLCHDDKNFVALFDEQTRELG
jgi:hypothetical protein